MIVASNAAKTRKHAEKRISGPFQKPSLFFSTLARPYSVWREFCFPVAVSNFPYFFLVGKDINFVQVRPMPCTFNYLLRNITWRPQCHVIRIRLGIGDWQFYCIAGFHMTSLKFKLQNYWSCWYFTLMRYKSSWKLIFRRIFVPNEFLVLW